MGPKLRFTLVSNEKEEAITVWPPDSVEPKTVHSSHPNYDKIKTLVLADDLEALKHIDLAEKVAIEFLKISDQVAVENGQVLFDGDVVDNSCTKQILRFLEEDRTDYQPLAKFFEKVMSNPQAHSREQLYAWLDKRDFAITAEGDIVAYKSVNTVTDGKVRDKGFTYESVTSGPAIVDGKRHKEGKVPQKDGSIVEIARRTVDKNPTVSCSHGLHVGDWSYASDFTGNTKLQVEVSPRDVVAVPNDSSQRKIRCCRYKVIGRVTGPIQGALKL